MAKEYDYLLKVLLVGDSDVGKTEILNNLDEDPMNEEGKATNQNKLYDSLICVCLQQPTRLQSFY
jgi:GTPase SAR1 family protein